MVPAINALSLGITSVLVHDMQDAMKYTLKLDIKKFSLILLLNSLAVSEMDNFGEGRGNLVCKRASNLPAMSSIDFYMPSASTPTFL